MIKEKFGEAQAESLIEDLGIDELPVRPSEVVTQINTPDFRVEMEYVSFQSPHILGRAEGTRDAALIYVNENIPNERRRNFTAAHEVGHVCLHIMGGKSKAFSCGKEQLSNHYEDPFEREANGFASGLLMPRSLIKRISSMDVNWNEIDLISRKCGTSLEASFRRLIGLNKEPFVLVIHRGGHFFRFVPSSNFEFFVNRTSLTRLQEARCADGLNGDFPATFERVDAIDWVNPQSRGGSLDSLYASSIRLERGFVYTLLTYDEDCYASEDDEAY